MPAEDFFAVGIELDDEEGAAAGGEQGKGQIEGAGRRGNEKNIAEAIGGTQDLAARGLGGQDGCFKDGPLKSECEKKGAQPVIHNLSIG